MQVSSVYFVRHTLGIMDSQAPGSPMKINWNQKCSQRAAWLLLDKRDSVLLFMCVKPQAEENFNFLVCLEEYYGSMRSEWLCHCELGSSLEGYLRPSIIFIKESCIQSAIQSIILRLWIVLELHRLVFGKQISYDFPKSTSQFLNSTLCWHTFHCWCHLILVWLFNG